MAQVRASDSRSVQGELKERLVAPRVPSARLHGFADCYKIKLHAAGYRLVYQVDDRIVLVTVIAVGKRDRGLVYLSAGERLARKRPPPVTPR
jgi:mRNA interferase RelE/StbE